MPLLSTFVFGSEKFGLTFDEFHPALYILNYPIYLYALCIVSGMCLAILTAAKYFKKRGIDPYDATIYALGIIPLGVLGARAYVYIFPWEGQVADWSTYWQFHNGGLGIYGGIIVGYIVVFVISQVKHQKFNRVVDCILPGVMLAQSMGRWGNFFNQEAYGNLITENYSTLPNWLEWITGCERHGFNGYAVWIDNLHSGFNEGWYQATFFYEAVCTFVGFLICVLILTRNKNYRFGWCAAFYGIYYGTVRLIIEGMRTDSLFLYVGTVQTDIKISQLVSICAIIGGIWTLTKIYRKEIHGLYKKLFANDYCEMKVSRWLLLALAVLLLGGSITLFAFGGYTNVLVGVALLLAGLYCGLGVWSICDRLQVYCPTCQKQVVDSKSWQTDYQKYLTSSIVYAVACVALVVFGSVSLVKWGIAQDIPNGVVLAVVCYALALCDAIFLLSPAIRKTLSADKTKVQVTANCDGCNSYGRVINLNKFLLFVFPPKKYAYYGLKGIKEWVDPETGK